ncbi:MAG: sugar phosphate isomerase/epimerase [Anaerolineales bacterium]|nr:sugar phosphate isomerase/epimerase [Anaerolineales bacterium]
MKYAINNWVYNDEPIRETFDRLSRFGYDGVELKGEPSLYDIDEIKSLIQEFNMAVTSVLGWTIWGIPGRDLSSPDEEERKAAVKFLKEVVDFSIQVGAPILLVLPFPAGRTTPTGDPQSEENWISIAETEWKNAVDSVQQVSTYALDHDITLAVEPINRFETYQLTTADKALKFIQEVGAGNVKLNLDSYHMNIDESDPAEAILRSGDYLVHMHVAGSNRQSPGSGHTDFVGLFKALKAVDFQGTVALEPVPPGADPGMAIKLSANLPLRDEYAKDGIAYLRDIEAAIAGQ